MPFNREIREGFTQGSVLVTAPDQVADSGVRLLKNARIDRVRGVVSSRPGMTQLTGSAIITLERVLSLHKLYGATDYSYAHVDTRLYRLTDAWGSPTFIVSATGTTPISAANMIDGKDNLHAYFTNGTMTPSKDDGTTLTNIGVAAPTAVPSAVALATDLSTLIDNMNDHTNWTGTGIGGKADEANIAQSGNSMTFTVAASTLGSVGQGSLATLDLDTLTSGVDDVKDDDYIHLWVRVDRPERVTYIKIDFDLDTGTLANAFRTNYYSVTLSGSAWLNQGADQWTKVQVPKSTFQRFGPDLLTKDWSTVESVQISFLTNSEGAITVYLDDFKLRGGTDIVGDVEYTAVYRNSASGLRGSPLKDSDDQVVWTTKLKDVDRQRVTITTSNIISGGAAHPGDTQIDKIILYRRIDEGEAFQIDEIDDTSASPYTDDTTVAELILSQTLEDDNDQPPSGKFIFGPGALNRLFMLSGRNDLYFSKAWQNNESRAENWPDNFRAKVGDGSEEALSGIVSDTQVIVWSNARTYEVQGFGADTFLPVAIPNSRGIVGAHAQAEGDGRLFFVSQDGIYQQIGLSQQRLTDAIAPFFRGETVSGQLGWNTTAANLSDVRLEWHSDASGPFLLMLYPEAGIGTNNKELVIKRNQITGEYTDFIFDSRTSTSLSALMRDREDNTLIAGASNSNIYQLEVHTVNDDAGSAFSYEFRSKSYHQGVPHGDKHYAEVVVEGNTNSESLTVEALYDKQSVTESLGSMSTSSDVGAGLFPTADPTAFRQDIGLRIYGSIDARVEIYRIGFYYEAQPEALTFWDSGNITLGFVHTIRELWWDMQSAAFVTATIYMDGVIVDTTQIPTQSVRTQDILELSAGKKSRQIRVTLSSGSAFRLYSLTARAKPYGTVAGFGNIPLIGRAA